MNDAKMPIIRPGELIRALERLGFSCTKKSIGPGKLSQTRSRKSWNLCNVGNNFPQTSVPHHKLLLESRLKGKGVGSDQATQRCWSQQVAFEPTSPKTGEARTNSPCCKPDPSVSETKILW